MSDRPDYENGTDICCAKHGHPDGGSHRPRRMPHMTGSIMASMASEMPAYSKQRERRFTTGIAFKKEIADAENSSDHTVP